MTRTIITTAVATGGRALPALLLSLTMLAGCTDRLAPPTAAVSIPEETILYSSLGTPDPSAKEPAMIATISSRGRDRRVRSVEGTIVAKGGNTVVIVRTDSNTGIKSLLVGPYDGTDQDFRLLDIEQSDNLIDPGSVAIAPDGARVAYYSNDGYYDTRLNVVDLSTPSQSTPLMISLSTFGQATPLPAPRFSPSGENLAYIDLDQSVGYVLAVTPTNSLQPRIVGSPVFTSGSVAIFDWSSTGDTLIYSGFDMTTGTTGIRMVEQNGADDHQIVSVPVNEPLMTPAWSPDGRTFAYTLLNVMTGETTLLSADVAGTSTTTIGEVRTMIFDLQWSGDGRQILYTAVDRTRATFDFQIPTGILMTVDVASKRFVPLATNALKGFWLE